MATATLTWLALSTLVSEDLASIAGGLLARGGRLRLADAAFACAAGVYAGDLGLWWAGRLLSGLVAQWPRLRPVIDSTRLTMLAARVDGSLATAVVVSRFVPGTRLPMYVAMGMFGRRPLAFAVWSLIAVLMWTPLIVISTAWFGQAVSGRLMNGARTGLLVSVVTAIAVLGATKSVGWIVARSARSYHQRFAQTIETPI